MLKFFLTSIDGLPDYLAEHYKPVAQGGLVHGYRLHVDGIEKILDSAKVEREHRLLAESHSRELEERLARVPDETPPAELSDEEAAEIPGEDHGVQVTALRKHSKKLLGEKKKMQERVTELEAELADARAPKVEQTPQEKWIAENAQRLAPFAPGSEEWKAEFAKLEAEMQPFIDAAVAETTATGEAQVAELNSQYARIRAEHEAQALVAGIARPGCAALLTPIVAERLRVARKDDDWLVTAVTANGTTTSLEGLREELRETPAFARLITGASASDKEAHARRVAETLAATRH